MIIISEPVKLKYQYKFKNKKVLVGGSFLNSH